MQEEHCAGPDSCRYIAPRQQGTIAKFFAQHWLPFVIYIFTFGTMVQQNRQSNAMVPQLDSRVSSIERTQAEAIVIQKQSLDLLKALNDEFRAYKDKDLETSAAIAEITRRNEDDISQIQGKLGMR